MEESETNLDAGGHLRSLSRNEYISVINVYNSVINRSWWIGKVPNSTDPWGSLCAVEFANLKSGEIQFAQSLLSTSCSDQQAGDDDACAQELVV